MKPSIFTSFNRKIPFVEALAAIRQAGFDIVAVDGDPAYSGYNTPAGQAALQRLLARHALQADSVHAPFPEADSLFALDEERRLESVRQAKLAVDTAALLDAGVVALHLIPYGITDAEQERRMVGQGRRSLTELADYAGAKNIKLALENGQQQPYDLVLERMLAEFGDPVGLCYDTGHANVRGNCFDLLEKYAARLLNFHIHDNRGSDTHALPGEGTIDWEKFRDVCRRHRFAHNLHIEAHPANSAFKDTAEFLAEARKRAESLI